MHPDVHEVSYNDNDIQAAGPELVEWGNSNQGYGAIRKDRYQ